MILKERSKSINYRILESLNIRMSLSAYEKAQYEKQIIGFEGEQLFDTCMKMHQPNGLILNDLLLSTRDTFYQIDSLLITSTQIYLYEVKNYSGSYHFKDSTVYSESGHALQDPVGQAERKRSYLYNLLLNQGLQIEVASYVVFINPDFYIYNYPEQKSVIFAGQLSAHLKSLNKDSSDKDTLTQSIANKLIGQHIESYRPQNMPDYSYSQLKKGGICPECFSFKYTTSRQIRTCTNCGFHENVSAAIYRNIEEFRLLFPSIPVKKQIIYEWCGSKYSKSRIQDVLTKNYCRKSFGRGSYYESLE